MNYLRYWISEYKGYTRRGRLILYDTATVSGEYRDAVYVTSNTLHYLAQRYARVLWGRALY